MQKHSILTLATAALLATNLQAQNTNVQSFTDADLNQMTPPSQPSNPSSMPGTSTSATATQNTPFKYPALTQEQIQQINDQLNAQIQDAEQRVQNFTNLVKDSTRMPMSIDKVELESAIIDLDVKKTLAAKFQGSPSLRSPKVRQVLMQIMSKKYIQESDLATLQAVVDAERPYTYP